MPDLRVAEPEECRDDVTESVAYQGHESRDGHERRRKHRQDGAADSNACQDADHHNSNHQ